VRFDPNDDRVVYRFSGLEPARLYAVNLTLYEGDGAGRQEAIQIDGTPAGTVVPLSSLPQYVTVQVPPSAYSDGVIDVAVIEQSGNGVPVLSEIAMEEQTYVEGAPAAPAVTDDGATTVATNTLHASWSLAGAVAAVEYAGHTHRISAAGWADLLLRRACLQRRRCVGADGVQRRHHGGGS
jgi:hypothetical protein